MEKFLVMTTAYGDEVVCEGVFDTQEQAENYIVDRKKKYSTFTGYVDIVPYLPVVE